MHPLVVTSFENVLRCTSLGSLAILAVLLVRWLGTETLSARARCLMWLPVFFLLVAPRLPDIGIAIQKNKSMPEVEKSVPMPTELPLRAEQEGSFSPSPPMLANPTAEQPYESERKTERSPADAPSLPFDWMRALAQVWLIGMVGLVLVWGVGYVTLRRRIKRQREQPSLELLVLVADCAHAFRVARPPRLEVTRAVRSPALIGILRPTIVVPKSMLDTFGQAEMRMALLHEMGHVRRRDLWFHWATLAIHAVHWFNPIIWLAGKQFRADREVACDAAVLQVTGKESRHLYGFTLIKLQSALAADTWKPINGMLGSLDMLKQRIREIGRSRPNSGRVAALAVMLVVSLSAVIAFAAAQSLPVQAASIASDPLKGVAEKPAPSGRVFTPLGLPASGAEVWLFSSKGVVAKTRTDSSGNYAFEESLIYDRPDAIGSRRIYTVVATLEGYGFGWRNIRSTDPRGNEFPLQLTEECVYHGKLMDLKGQPLENGRVWCVGASFSKGEGYPREICYLDSKSRFLQVNADGDGLFTVRGLPPGGIGINAGNADSWITYHWFENFDKLDGKRTQNRINAGSADSLVSHHWLENLDKIDGRLTQHRLHCGPGTTLRGQVLTKTGDPVTGAEVHLETAWRFHAERSTITDEAGVFEFTNLYNTTGVFNPGEAPHVVAIRHADYTAVPQVIKLKPGQADDLTIEAIPGTLIEGVMIDRESLKPIADGELRLSMDLEGRDYHYGTEFRTDREGHFQWRIAQPIRLSIKTMPLGFCFVEPDDPIPIRAEGDVKRLIFEAPPMRPMVKVTITTDPPLPGCELDFDYKKNLRAGADPDEAGRGQLRIRDVDGKEYNGWRPRKADGQGRLSWRDVPSDSEMSIAVTSADGNLVALTTIKTNQDPEQKFAITTFSEAVHATFKLIDEHGNPWSNTDIQLDLKADDAWLIGFRNPTTDKDGAFTVKGLPERAQLGLGVRSQGDWRYMRQIVQLPDEVAQPMVVKIENTENVWVKDKSGRSVDILSVDDVMDKTGKSYGAASILRELDNNGFVISRKTMPSHSGYTITFVITTKDGRKLRATGQNTSRNDEPLHLVVE